jgi:hypothetical protein
MIAYFHILSLYSPPSVLRGGSVTRTSDQLPTFAGGPSE